MQDMIHRHEYDNFMPDVPTYKSKNMDIADWLIQIEKESLLHNSKEYELATAKYRSTDIKF